MSTDETLISEHTMAVFSSAPGIELTAIHDSRIAIIGGQHMDNRYMEWNFVSSRRERIEQAKSDWKAQAFPKVIGDEQEFISLPE